MTYLKIYHLKLQTIHFFHSFYEISWFFEADEAETFALVGSFVSYNFCSVKRTVFTESSGLKWKEINYGIL